MQGNYEIIGFSRNSDRTLLNLRAMNSPAEIVVKVDRTKVPAGTDLSLGDIVELHANGRAMLIHRELDRAFVVLLGVVTIATEPESSHE